MFNLIMLMVAFLCMCACWNYTEKAGSFLMWACTVVSGCICLIYTLMIGGIL